MIQFRNKLTQRLKEFDWSLVRGSTLISIGTALARVLGLAFSLVLAAVFTSGEYGEVRYAIAVASIVSIITMPFGQHLISRFVSKYRSDATNLNSILTNSLFILPCLFLLTLLVTVPVLLAMGKFNIGILAIFLGETLFYAYWGLTSGFLEPRRLTIAYLSSNIIQILLVFVLIKILNLHSTTLALLIYGLSYLLPLTVLMLWWPLPGNVGRQFIDRNIIKEMLHFSVPIWISHACYTFSITFDLLFLERLGNASQLGAYSLSKTLASIFIIVPSGISTLLMPKIAQTGKEKHGSLLLRMVIISLFVDGIILLIYTPLIQPLTLRFFGQGYWVPMSVSMILAVYMILYGFHGLISAVLVGRGTPQFESMSRIAELVVTGLGCLILIPNSGWIGAAIAMLAGKLAALIIYVIVARFGRTVTENKVGFLSLIENWTEPNKNH